MAEVKETKKAEVKEVTKEVKENKKETTRVFVPKAPEAKPAAAPRVAAPKAEAREVAAPVVVREKAKAAVKIKSNGTIATGRRKKSIARVRKVAGTGKIIINGEPMEKYFVSGFLKLIVNQPISAMDISHYDIIVNVHGGGLTGQAGAIRHGIARVLVKEDETLKPELKKAGYLRRDPRMKERKKYGLKKARRAPQFSKR